MMKDNIIENVFYRFNPYFPDRQLPVYDINPAEPVRDCTVKLGKNIRRNFPRSSKVCSISNRTKI